MEFAVNCQQSRIASCEILLVCGKMWFIYPDGRKAELLALLISLVVARRCVCTCPCNPSMSLMICVALISLRLLCFQTWGSLCWSPFSSWEGDPARMRWANESRDRASVAGSLNGRR